MSLRVLIIEDQEYAIDPLIDFIRQTPGLIYVGFETDPIVALEKLNSGQIVADIILLDIEMPGMTGIELASALLNFYAVIFTTGFKEHAPDAFDVDAVDYLLKPVSLPRFLLAIIRAERRLWERRATGPEPSKYLDYLFIPGSGKNNHYKILTDDIRYIQGASSYSNIFTTSTLKSTHFTHYPIKDLSLTLDGRKFLRIHKSYIVNIAKVESVNHKQVVMDNEDELPIGETYKADVRNKLRLR